MSKEIVIKDTARQKGTKAYTSAIKEANKVTAKEHTTKHGITIKKLAKLIILF